MSEILGPAIGLIELTSLAKGYQVMDVLVKQAPVRIMEASSMSPGKFFILFNGDVASCEESFKVGVEACKTHIIDSVLIPQMHDDLLLAYYGQLKNEGHDSVGFVETATLTAGLYAADLTAKNADVKLIEIRSSRGIGGKSLYFFTGRLDEVQAGREAAIEGLKTRGTLIASEVITNPHSDFLSYFNLSGEA